MSVALILVDSCALLVVDIPANPVTKPATEIAGPRSTCGLVVFGPPQSSTPPKATN